jgi:predicted nucleic acid-binding protein
MCDRNFPCGKTRFFRSDEVAAPVRKKFLELGCPAHDDAMLRTDLHPFIILHRGDLMAQSHRSGVALSVPDGCFAATALANNLTLVTRNLKDFAPFGVTLFNRWDG